MVCQRCPVTFAVVIYTARQRRKSRVTLLILLSFCFVCHSITANILVKVLYLIDSEMHSRISFHLRRHFKRLAYRPLQEYGYTATLLLLLLLKKEFLTRNFPSL